MQLQVGIRGFLDNYLENNPQFKKDLKIENYYKFERLEEYITKIYEDSELENSNLKNTIQDSDGFTNLRQEKNTSSAILEKVKTGSEIEVLDKTGDWWLVVTKAGNKGYIFKTKIVSE